MILFDFPEEIQQFLRPADCEGRDNYAASPAERLPEQVCQERNRGKFGGFMHAGSVRGFDQQEISFRDRLRIPDDRLFQVADVPAADELPPLAAVLEEKLRKRRPEQVSRIRKPHGKPFVDHIDLVIFAGDEKIHGGSGVFCRIERFHHGAAVAQVLFRLIGRVGLLDVRAVRQHDGAKVHRFRRGIDGTAESLFIQERQHTGMVDVRMRQENIFNPGRSNRKLRLDKGVIALFHSVIHKEKPAVRPFHERSAARYLVGGPQKGDLHVTRYLSSLFRLQINRRTDIIYPRAGVSPTVRIVFTVQNNAVNGDAAIFSVSVHAFHAVVTDLPGIKVAAVAFTAADTFPVIKNALTMNCHDRHLPVT